MGENSQQRRPCRPRRIRATAVVSGLAVAVAALAALVLAVLQPELAQAVGFALAVFAIAAQLRERHHRARADAGRARDPEGDGTV
ncbi:hypothetical protein [Streptomyces sp. IMTB 1903]|uniref:hypothetical protein n=1 Tax=Streptomyces sp. IMTB 1903 TaxID=1776680 RepID=UPI00075349EE|nr:hypothetical protein [Streptomyces sp. IMTB 1903]